MQNNMNDRGSAHHRDNVNNRRGRHRQRNDRGMAAMSVFAYHTWRNSMRTDPVPMHNSVLTGQMRVHEILNGHPRVIQGATIQQAAYLFQHSKETTSRWFNAALFAICALKDEFIRPPDYTAVQPLILEHGYKYRPWFDVNYEDDDEASGTGPSTGPQHHDTRMDAMNTLRDMMADDMWERFRSDPWTGTRERETSNEVSEEGQAHQAKDYVDPPPAPLIDTAELKLWSFYRALIAEFIATLLFLYVTVATIIGHVKQRDACDGVDFLGIAWAFGGMIFLLVYCTAGISGGHINPAVTFGLFLARKVTLIRAVAYIVAQCLGAICGVWLVKAFMKDDYKQFGGGVNSVAGSYSIITAYFAEIIGTFVLVYTVFSATDPKRSLRDSHVPVLAPLPIGFAVFVVHLATIPITGTGINPARSFGAAVIFNDDKI
ncbi:hypothetical protein TIFTF001_007426 [Ficus carica]|uniref:Uncharacterized protein n=1 Tax=Ficus carica TaxID=3494 RepID=A0AA87ZQD3_FICCA|nr:hypothetical protein TIFTF001_007426 [Ficus carica]